MNSEFDLRRGDGSEPFLTCSVPDLEFYSFSINLYSSNLKVNSNCGYVTAYKVHKSMNVYSVMKSWISSSQHTLSLCLELGLYLRTQWIRSWMHSPPDSFVLSHTMTNTHKHTQYQTDSPENELSANRRSKLLFPTSVRSRSSIC